MQPETFLPETGATMTEAEFDLPPWLERWQQSAAADSSFPSAPS